MCSDAGHKSATQGQRAVETVSEGRPGNWVDESIDYPINLEHAQRLL